MSPSDLEKLIDLKTAVKSGGSKQDSMLTDEARLKHAVTSLGIDPKKNPADAMRVTEEIDRRVRAASEAKGGRPLSPDEKQAEIDRVVKDEVMVPAWGSDTKKSNFALSPDEQKKAYVTVGDKPVLVSSVPPGERYRIIKALHERRKSVNEQSIVELYMEGEAKKLKPGNTQQHKPPTGAIFPEMQ